MIASLATERILVPHVGRLLTSQYLSAAERIIAGQGEWHTQEIMSPAGLIYMRRHFISGRAARPQVWAHEILLSDPDRWMHDHPWDYTSVIVSGSYDEETPTGIQQIDEGDHVERSAESLHRLHLTSPVVTLFVTPRARRQWGFMTDRGWVSAREYLA